MLGGLGGGDFCPHHTHPRGRFPRGARCRGARGGAGDGHGERRGKVRGIQVRFNKVQGRAGQRP